MTAIESDRSSPRRALLTRPAEQSALWFLGALLQVRAGGRHTGGRFAIIEHTARRGYNAPAHVHAADDETFLVIDGNLRVHFGGETYETEPGGFALLPHGVEHAFVVTSPDARFLTFHQPAGFDDFVMEVGTSAPSLVLPPAPDGSPAPEALQALSAAASRYGITIVGPPPAP
ncbi:MAG: cupin domain-containing protein [Acidimicrobiales bacterium]